MAIIAFAASDADSGFGAKTMSTAKHLTLYELAVALLAFCSERCWAVGDSLPSRRRKGGGMGGCQQANYAKSLQVVVEPVAVNIVVDDLAKLRPIYCLVDDGPATCCDAAGGKVKMFECPKHYAWWTRIRASGSKFRITMRSMRCQPATILARLAERACRIPLQLRGGPRALSSYSCAPDPGPQR